MTLLALYARKEPTTDPIALAHGLEAKKDVVLYRDLAGTQFVARWSWYLSRRPRRGQKRVTLNCWRWELLWCD